MIGNPPVVVRSPAQIDGIGPRVATPVSRPSKPSGGGGVKPKPKPLPGGGGARIR